jgi:FkbH-like protein
VSAYADLLAALRATLPATPGIAVIHSSISMLMPPREFRPGDALRAFDQLIQEGWTIALPAFTFSFCGGRRFDRHETPSEVGLLADRMLEGLVGARRTDHPIYSFVVKGPRADAVLACRSETTFGAGSPFELFEREDATLVMLGCGWTYCTSFHRYEELAEVPYRYFKRFEGEADSGGGTEPVSASMFVRDIELDPQNDFAPAVAALRSEGAIRSAPLWRAEVESVGAADLARVCAAQLKADPLAHLSNAAMVSAGLSRRRARQANDPVRIAVLGHANVELVRTAVGKSVAFHIDDRRIETFSVPYGQLDQELLSPASGLAAFDADYSLFCDRLEDLAGAALTDEVAEEQLAQSVRAYAAGIAAYRARARGWLFVARFADLLPSSLPGAQRKARLEAMNRLLEAELAGVAQLAWIDLAQEAAACGAAPCDMRLWLLGRFPFSRAMDAQIARRVTGLVLAASGRTVRLIVLDLDNTLWGGVLGEDGIEGIRLGGDYPGNAHKALQRALRRLSERGIALAVASKNDADLALAAIDNHPEMEIRSVDLVGHRINWQPKSDNILALCEELNLGPASALFVDDNPVEREIVRRAAPEVKILELPQDPAGFVEALLASPWLAAIEVTAEDQKRVESYRARAKIEAARRSAVSLEDFYAGLGMTLYLQPLAAGNVARAAQLCMKTNQFNTTTHRYDATDLQAMAAAGDDVVVLGLSDRMTERENIGLIILRADAARRDEGAVDIFLLSCRVLGRGIEGAVMDWALRRASQRGWITLNGEIVETERNTPVRAVFSDAGFEAGGNGRFHRSTSDAPGVPSWLSIRDSVSAPHRSAAATG